MELLPAEAGLSTHSKQEATVLAGGPRLNQVGHSVTLTGTGTENGRPVAFTTVAADSSMAPPGLFGITLGDGYNNSGSLLDGSLTVY